MRIRIPHDFTPQDAQAHPLTFNGAAGERLQISVLEDDLVRVEHFPTGSSRSTRTWAVVGPDGDVPREGRRRDDLAPFSLPPYTVLPGDDSLTLQTQALRLRVSLADPVIEWADGRGRTFASDLPQRAYAYDRASNALFHYMVHRPDAHYYGFGEKAGPLDKRERHIRMTNLDALGYNAELGDPLYKSIPFYIVLEPDLNLAYGLFYDTLARCEFDMRSEHSHYYDFYRTFRAEDGDLDYYLIYGPTVAEVVAKFSKLIGRMILPPRWSLGYLGSTMYYTDMPDAQQQLQGFVDLCAQYDIPCDLFHLSSGYTTGPDDKRYVFNWNNDKVPDPQGMVEHFSAAGIHLAANIKPCLLTTHPRYEEVKARGGFLQQADTPDGGHAPFINLYWGGDGSHLDFTNPDDYDWWKDGVRSALLEYGILSTWNDNNEYEIWDDEVRCQGFGEPQPISRMRPVQTLLMARASYEAQREYAPDTRPYLISRSAAVGTQRYAQTWSGDNATSWHTLRYNIPMGLGISLSGLPNTGHDVGGFAGPKPDAELFVRWVQNGIFHPRFCIHSWNTDGTVNEPWMYPDALPLIRDAIRFRYRLIPYLYSLVYQAAQTGAPIIRPLVYQFQDDPRTHTASFDFMLGPNLLVASVLERGARTRSVYLPRGAAWCDVHSGVWRNGGQSVTLDAPLDRMPLLAPAGALIPLGKAMQHVGAEPDDVRTVWAFPHPQNGSGTFTLIEDDGVSLGYQRGEVSHVRLSVEAAPESLALAATVTRAGYPLPYDQVEFVLPPGESRPTNGEEVSPGEAPTSERAPGMTGRRVRVPVVSEPVVAGE